MESKSLTVSRRKTIDEHRELFEAVDYIRRILAGGSASRALIVHLLRDLSVMLLEHFRQEETGGYFAETFRVAPHLAGRVEGLLSQHRQMADLLASLFDSSMKQEPLREWWQRVDTGYAHFTSLFISHEEAENTLLQDLYLDDVGEGD